MKIILFCLFASAALALGLFVLILYVRGCAVRKAASDHATYEADRVGKRKRASFHGDHRETAIHQRAQRILHKWKIPITLEQVRRILEK